MVQARDCESNTPSETRRFTDHRKLHSIWRLGMHVGAHSLGKNMPQACTLSCPQDPNFEPSNIGDGNGATPHTSAAAAPQAGASAGENVVVTAIIWHNGLLQESTPIVHALHAPQIACLRSHAASDNAALGNSSSRDAQQPASSGNGLLARLSNMVQRGGGIQRVLFVNHALLVVL